MFNIFKGKTDSLKVTLDRPSGIYAPGESLTATISFESGKDVKVQEGKAVLICAEQYDFQSLDQSTDSDGTSSSHIGDHQRTDEHEIDWLIFAGEGTLEGGKEHTFTFSATIPNPALPTINGKIIKVYWYVKAKLDRKLASDFNAQADVIVLSPQVGEEAQPELTSRSGEEDQATLSLELPSTSWKAGSTIRGELLIHPLKKFDASQVRLELVRKEAVSYDLGLDKEEAIPVKLAGKTGFAPGKDLRLPFQIELPLDCSPGAGDDIWTFSWMLRAVLPRFLHKDVFMEREIKVYNEQAA